MGKETCYEHELERQLAHMHLVSYEPPRAFNGLKSLPPEVLCKIFWHCTANYIPISANGRSTPLILSQVSSRWRSVALGYPSIWNEILIDCGDWSNMSRLVQLAHLHLERSGNKPISIHTSGAIPPWQSSPEDTNVIEQLLSPYAPRIRHITLAFPIDWMNNFLRNNTSIDYVRSLESLRLVYHPAHKAGQPRGNNLFGHAPRLRKVELESASELCKFLEPNKIYLPWSRIEELNLIQIVASTSYLQSILVRCSRLRKCTLSIIKVPEEMPTHSNHVQFLVSNPPQFHPAAQHKHIYLSSVKYLTLYNPRNFDYAKYLATLRIHFTSLEHFSILTDGDPRNGKRWSHVQFMQLMAENTVPLLSVSTPAHISEDDIESIIGEAPSLVELDVSKGSSISETTVRLMLRGHLGSQLEVLKCAVAPELLSYFLDMFESRFVSKKSQAKYRGFKKLVIRCPKDSDGYREVRERIEELQSSGHDITIVDA